MKKIVEVLGSVSGAAGSIGGSSCEAIDGMESLLLLCLGNCLKDRELRVKIDDFRRNQRFYVRAQCHSNYRAHSRLHPRSDGQNQRPNGFVSDCKFGQKPGLREGGEDFAVAALVHLCPN